jgi:hypothetical protein
LVAKWIQKNDYHNTKRIYAYAYKPYAIQAYFDKPIFVNSDKTWYDWVDSLSDSFDEHFAIFNQNVLKDIERHNPDIILFSTFSEKPELLYEYLKNKNIEYRKICSVSTMYYKNYPWEGSGYCVLFLHENQNEY